MTDAQTAELRVLTRQLEQLNHIGAALSAEHDTATLLNLILTKAREITGSDAGSLYVVERLESPDEDVEAEPRRALRFMIAQNDSVSLPFKQVTLDITDASIAGYVAMTGHLVSLDDAYVTKDDVPYTFNRSFDVAAGYRTRSVLAVPMRSPRGAVVGVIQLINSKRVPEQPLRSAGTNADEVIPYSSMHRALVTSLAAQAAIALENSQLYQSVQALFEGFVRASVVAIEARDPATAGHSFRVANLTVALAESVDLAPDGPFANVRFSRDDMRTIRYASLLHDFGKVGVREEVLVKARKLYPLQADVIRQRFLLARRTRENEWLQSRLDVLLREGRDAYEARAEALEAACAADLAQLEADLATIERANEPTLLPNGEFEVLHAIALRSFDAGGGARQSLLEPDEVTMLSLRQGTLSEEERRQIESHVTHTYNFLRQIPWTPGIRRITGIAAAHHEKLNGEGYPRRLGSQDIPIQARMMTICDIFDALSAADRPYKKAVPIERALEILAQAVTDGDIDGDLFRLFVDARVYDRWRVEPFPY